MSRLFSSYDKPEGNIQIQNRKKSKQCVKPDSTVPFSGVFATSNYGSLTSNVSLLCMSLVQTVTKDLLCAYSYQGSECELQISHITPTLSSPLDNTFFLTISPLDFFTPMCMLESVLLFQADGTLSCHLLNVCPTHSGLPF